MTSFKDRIIRAAMLDIHLYEEVKADTGAMGQAMGVVVLSSVAAGIGAMDFECPMVIITGTIGVLIGWYIWALLTYWIGAKLFSESQTKADVRKLLRTIGFSSSPGLIRVLGILPGLVRIVFFITSIWMLVAMVIAVRQALDYKSTGWAVGACLFGWLIQYPFLIIGLVFGGGGPFFE